MSEARYGASSSVLHSCTHGSVRTHRLWSTTDILLYVLQFLDTASLSRTASISQGIRDLTRKELRGRVRVVLGRHIPADLLDDFFGILQSTSSVVSGSLAFAVLSWGSDTHFSTWETPGDLDIYVPRGTTDTFVRFFADRAAFVPGVPKDAHMRTSDYPAGIHTVTTLVKSPALDPPVALSVDIVESEDSRATYPLQNFWGTVVNNFITPSSIVSAYPRATLMNVCFGHPWIAGRRPYAKYRERGVEVVYDLDRTR